MLHNKNFILGTKFYFANFLILFFTFFYINYALNFTLLIFVNLRYFTYRNTTVSKKNEQLLFNLYSKFTTPKIKLLTKA
ncbi:hypothetical protein BpHYR1_014317 [Brachionus plicatilis]|uniref:Uncharacterized protein n=1 Tax=Brachionus plicatilis TaxID=10195 RepID=A0A3M7Q788_BRAPC|nr:hypothetical protein BpHYR1_014317 [Brachionus plicatilis]